MKERPARKQDQKDPGYRAGFFLYVRAAANIPLIHAGMNRVTLAAWGLER